ncbi:MAG: hypothetical protein J3K34DRAFT_475418 [Monoraphidium minutum]|nr:MAG: hypothetical protein J3K34DRAFT_475418 [Monoraphidium minutum]
MQGDDDSAFELPSAEHSGLSAAAAGAAKRHPRWREWLEGARPQASRAQQQQQQEQRRRHGRQQKDAHPLRVGSPTGGSHQQRHAPATGEGQRERPQAPRKPQDRCRAWLAQQQERLRAAAAPRRGGGAARVEVQVKPLRLGKRSDTGESSASGGSSADGCVRVSIGAPRAAPHAKSEAAAPGGGAALEPVTLADVWRAGSGAAAAAAGLRRESLGAVSDAWFDATSCFDALEQPESPRARRAADRAPAGPPLQTPADGAHVPDPPLELPDREAFEFVPVPAATGFGGYWQRDAARTPPGPQPIDVMLGAGRFVARAHESIPGIWLQDGPHQLTMTAKPRSIPLGPLSRYVETFAKDGGETHWNMRRDIKVGRSSGRMYFTTCGTLIFRVYTYGLFSSEPELVNEEYSRLARGGKEIITLQRCLHYASGRTADQVLIGNYVGPTPPPGDA